MENIVLLFNALGLHKLISDNVLFPVPQFLPTKIEIIICNHD